MSEKDRTVSNDLDSERKKYEEARELILEAHKDQVDKAGKPYVEHLFRVSQRLYSMQGKKLALLHDLLEDTHWTEEMLAHLVTEEELFILRLLTRKPNQPYEDYIQGIRQHPMAVRIKLADLADNLDPTRILNPTQKDIERSKKYRRALQQLTQPREGR